MAPMESKPWGFPGKRLLLMLAGWINRHQQAVIAYQREETNVLREMLGGKRLRFTDQQRRPYGPSTETKRESRCGSMVEAQHPTESLGAGDGVGGRSNVLARLGALPSTASRRRWWSVSLGRFRPSCCFRTPVSSRRDSMAASCWRVIQPAMATTRICQGWRAVVIRRW